WMRCHSGDACRANDGARPLDESLSSLPAPPRRSLSSLPAPPLRSLSSLPAPPLRSLSSLPAPPLRSLSSLPVPPLCHAVIRTGTLPRCRDQRRHQMKTIISILAVAFLAVTPAAAKSAASFAPGHHHVKGIHGVSSSAPGHLKRLHMQSSAR